MADLVKTGPPLCEIRYTVHGTWRNGFIAQLWIKNVSAERIKGWHLRWDFAGDEKVTNLWGGDATQTGDRVRVDSLRYNGTIWPGSRTTIGFVGRSATAPMGIENVSLNGTECTVVDGEGSHHGGSGHGAPAPGGHVR